MTIKAALARIGNVYPARHRPDTRNAGSLFCICFGYEPEDLARANRRRLERDPRRARVRPRYVPTVIGPTDKGRGRRHRKLDRGLAAVALYRNGEA